MLSVNHDLRVLDFINDVNAPAKSKSVKKSSKRKVWKPTGKVFTNIGYTWRPTGQTFNIVGNLYPLTRLTTTTEVPLRKPTALKSNTPKPVVTLVYSRKRRKFKTNFVNKFLGIVKFRINHVAKILGYGDYQIGNVTISKVYYVEGLRHNLFFVGQFCDSNLKVAFRQHTCFIHNLEDVDLLTGSRGNNMYTLSLGEMRASSPICLLSKASKTKYDDVFPICLLSKASKAKSWLWHRCLSHLNFGAINHAKAPLLLWAEAVATACYTQNHSIIRLRHGKTPYELLLDKLPNLLFFHVFGALCYPTNDSENLRKLQLKSDIGIFIGNAPTKKAFRIYNRHTRRIIETIHVDFDELTAMDSEHSSLEPVLHEMTLATISSGLVPNPPPSTSVDHPAPKFVSLIDEVAAPVPAISTGSPSSTIVDQDAPSPSNSQTTPETQPLVILNDVEEDNHDIEVAHMDNDPYFGLPIL
ncbi:retrovirus-related pol polyprotein from transposon TNT 1-94, partial [Tanacetum coccineum]